MKFFLDNCLSPKLARSLRILEPNAESGLVEIYHIAELEERLGIARNADDVEWIRALGADGDWVIISGDEQIVSKPAERAAWRESGLTAFFFSGRFENAPHWAKVQLFIKWWERIQEEGIHHRDAPRGSGYKIPMRRSHWEVIRNS